MSWWMPHKFDEKRDFLLMRARVLKALRLFFEGRDFLEVQTPALQVCPVMDAHIHAFATDIKAQDRVVSSRMYLHTSPEFDMKKLLVAGLERIYQICPVFRNAEGSKTHSPEFTLLEWYRAGANYRVLMDDTVDMLRYVAESLDVKSYTHGGKTSDPFGNWDIISVQDAFMKYAKIDLLECLGKRDEFALMAQAIGIRVIESDAWDDIFHAIMSEKIEPFLGFGVPSILYDYPISMAALSRKKESDPRFAERFEVYICGIELANAFSELTDAQEQRRRYEEEMQIKEELYGESYPADEEFFKALEYGIPESAGIALGIDRLIMLACGAKDIDDVLWAPVQKGF
ncbi:MAG: EF-P lysine aminoacylase EpmA [Alphaproteobacteria bacterium]